MFRWLLAAMDAEDARLIAQGFIVLLLAAVIIVAMAATAGVAWRVFELLRGL